MSHSSPKKLFLIVLVIAVVALAAYLWHSREKPLPPARGTGAIPVVITPALRTDVPHLLNTVGTVESLHSVVVRPQIEGLLTQVLFEEGQYVEQGQLIATIDDRVLQATLNSARAERASNESRLRSAEADLARYTSLIEHNAISRQVLDQQAALVEQLKADIARDQANIEDAQVRLSYTQIHSPVSGRAGIRRVDAGNLVRPTDPEGIVSITQMHPISVLFSVAQSSLEPLRRTREEPQSDLVWAVDRNSGKLLASGPISAIDNAVRTGSGTVQIRANFNNADERLWPGQFVAVRVPVGYSRDAITVPSVAVRLGLNTPFVYRIAEDDTAELVPVAISYRDEDSQRTVIIGDIEAGDKIVVDGFVRLKPGTRISIAEEIPAELANATVSAPQKAADHEAAQTSDTIPGQPAGSAGTSAPPAATQAAADASAPAALSSRAAATAPAVQESK